MIKSLLGLLSPLIQPLTELLKLWWLHEGGRKAQRLDDKEKELETIKDGIDARNSADTTSLQDDPNNRD